jgi:hypothetical protein
LGGEQEAVGFRGRFWKKVAASRYLQGGSIKRYGYVLSQLIPFIKPDVPFAPGYLDALSYSLHCFLPVRVMDLKPAQPQHPGGVDFSRFVYLEGIIHQHLDLRPGITTPRIQALGDDLLSNLESFIKGQGIVHRYDKPVLTVIRGQRDVSFFASPSLAISTGREVRKGIDVFPDALFELPPQCLHPHHVIGNAPYRLIPQFVKVGYQRDGDEPSLAILHVPIMVGCCGHGNSFASSIRI